MDIRIAIAASLSLICLFAGGPLATAEESDPPGVNIADLQQQLNSMLKARRPLEFEFIDRVVQLVTEKQFSVGMVKSISQWAVRKNKNIPFPYFQRAMRILAQRQGVVI